jgi:hypothetical protein
MSILELPPAVSTRTSLLTHTRNAAVGFGFATGIITVLRPERIEHIFQFDFALIDVFCAATYVYLFSLGVFWYYTGSHELDLLQNWLKPIQFVPKRPITHITVVLGLGAFMGVLFGLVTRIWMFSIAYLLYLLFDIFTWRVRMEEIKNATDGARTTLKAIRTRVEGRNAQEILEFVTIHEAATDIIDAYYINKPHIRRVITVAIAVAILALCANAIRLIYLYKFPNESGNLWILITSYVSADRMREFFYTLFLLVMIIHETILAGWRREMDRNLDQLDARFQQLKLDAQLAKLTSVTVGQSSP